MLPMTASSTARRVIAEIGAMLGDEFLRQGLCFRAGSQRSDVDLVFSDCLSRANGGCDRGDRRSLGMLFDGFLGRIRPRLALPSVTTVELLQLDVSGSTWAVDAVVTAADSGAAGAGGGDPPPKMFEKKPEQLKTLNSMPEPAQRSRRGRRAGRSLGWRSHRERVRACRTALAPPIVRESEQRSLPQRLAIHPPRPCRMRREPGRHPWPRRSQRPDA